MNLLKNKSSIIIKSITGLSLLTFFSCKKITDSPPPVPKGAVGIHLHTNIDINEVDSGIVASDATGRKFQLNIAQFYAYNFVLKKTDGSSVSLKDYILKTIGKEMYVLGTVPTGNYSSLSFNIGVDPTNNINIPSSLASNSPLYTQDPNMWFGNAGQGYYFVNVQGLADTSVSQTLPVNQYQAFSYQLGTGSMLKTINLPTMPTPLSVTASHVGSNAALIHLTCDYGKLLQGVNFKTQSTATPFTNTGVVTHIFANMNSFIQYEM